MSINNYFSIKANIEFLFTNSQTRDFSYNSFLPEIEKLNAKRSKISMIIKEKSLIFNIESLDITAFRATISEIISLGKIVDGTLKICQ